jgi:glycosyltransferase involved in cell wall biosynthesis
VPADPPPPPAAEPADRVGPAHRALYAAFDRYPSSKGASVHIGEWADELFTTFGGGLLHVLGGGELPAYQREAGGGGHGTVEIVRFGDQIPNLLDRIEAYRGHLAAVLAGHADTLAVVHVRDPWSASVALAVPGRRFRLVVEVNGLPSVELPYRYRDLGATTIEKLRALEHRCLAAADRVVVPSDVLAERVRASGAPPDRVVVIRNGARLAIESPPRPAAAPDRYLVYVGALQAWQGVDTLLRAFARLRDLDDLRLVVCASTPPRTARGLRRLAGRLEVADRVDWHHRLPHAEIAGWLAHAAASVAPLADCSRNVDQGCCPLKVLESMAAGTPVVASDLAVVRELVVDGEHGRLVPADRPAELARALRILLEYPDRAAAMGAAGRRHIEATLTWDRSRAQLRRLYADVVDGSPVPSPHEAHG